MGGWVRFISQLGFRGYDESLGFTGAHEVNGHLQSLQATCMGGWERSQNWPEMAPAVPARLKFSRAPHRSRHSLTSPASMNL